MAIAIVSAGIRFPKARTLEEFWSHLAEGRDLSTTVSRDRWPLAGDALLAPEREGRDAISHARVYEVKDWRESSESLGLSPGFVEGLDPLFHLCLGAGMEAWRSCQNQTIDRQRATVILGNIALPTQASAERAYVWLRKSWGERFAKLSETASRAENNQAAALPAQILAAALDFGGIPFTLDAACASSLYAMALACDELLDRRVDFVLAGGLSRPASLYTQVGFTALSALSKSGRCYALDKRADGLMVGEGAGIFGLKRLEDALAAGDQILGIIRAVGLSNDREGRLMAPSTEGQLRAMRAAYQEAGWKPEDVDYIECHATGTPLGDATEFQSLKTLWSAAEAGQQAVIGSVKPNVGHMLTAAGAAGLAKILISLQKRTLPPTANFVEATASWHVADSPFRILSKPQVWPLSATRSRRAAISGFGFGGINAHLLLEEYDPDRHSLASVKTETSSTAQNKVVLVAARALTETQENLIRMRSWNNASQDRVIEEFQVAATDFRIPPAELREMLPQQLIALQLVKSLGIERFSEELSKATACYVGIELDPMANLFACRWAYEGDRPPGHRDASFFAKQDEIMLPLNANRVIGSLGSIVASRVAREWKLGGPSFTIASGERSALAALALAYAQIRKGKIRAAFVMAVDASASRRGRAQWDEIWEQAERPPVQEGGIAWCLMNREQALAEGLPILAELSDLRWIPADAEVDPSRTLGTLAPFLSLTEKLFTQSAPVLRSLTTQGQCLQLGREILTKPGRISRPDSEHTMSIKRDDLGSELPMAEKKLSPRSDSLALDLLLAAEAEQIRSHQAFLAYRIEGDALLAELLQTYVSDDEQPTALEADDVPVTTRWVGKPFSLAEALYDYAACQEFARGSIAKVFGPDFVEVDSYPTRVRLPDERLLLCHRVMSIEGQAKSLGAGRMITEHDVFPDAWYLEAGHMPTAIAVESGQADLMLSAFLGADFVTKGKAVYRLLDARVNFYRGLPKVGETIRYDIRIKRFFEQGGTLFFHFSFEATVDGEAFMSMQDGCAGFFSEEALAAGRGIMRSPLQLQPKPGKITGEYQPLMRWAPHGVSEADLDALRQGHYERAFGSAFRGLALRVPVGLPGGDMRLVHRIPLMEDDGGRFGLGRIIGEADIHPDDWFLTCHFVDDQVMPGTLMYECCLHTLRVLLMRKGWVGEVSDFSFDPVPGVWSQLKCRGQVLAHTRQVSYEIEIKEMGFRPEPYVICDALMSADGKPIVDITDMSLRLSGIDASYFAELWSFAGQAPEALVKPAFTYEQILAFSSGRPSDCFGPVYQVFDEERRIARLPRPPFQFLDRIDRVEGPVMTQNVGTFLQASYECLPTAWYWDAEGSQELALAILVEIALQPCGFMAAYMGSALLSSRDLSFRNLSGQAQFLSRVKRGGGALTVEVHSTKINRTGDMVIQDYRFLVKQAGRRVYEGETCFGYFTPEALQQQVGLRGTERWQEPRCSITEPYPESLLLSRAPLLMVDTLGREEAPLGRYGLGVLYGRKQVDPKEWFFDAHFYQDPVMPGSLGLQAMEQVLKAEAFRLWPDAKAYLAPLDQRHSWTYRGQVIPSAGVLHYALHLKEVDSERRLLRADAWLYCDGLPIYSLEDLSLACDDDGGRWRKD